MSTQFTDRNDAIHYYLCNLGFCIVTIPPAVRPRQVRGETSRVDTTNPGISRLLLRSSKPTRSTTLVYCMNLAIPLLSISTIMNTLVLHLPP
jgi:hypothetical protein